MQIFYYLKTQSKCTLTIYIRLKLFELRKQFHALQRWTHRPQGKVEAIQAQTEKL